mgnify:CR=1 FL=1
MKAKETLGLDSSDDSDDDIEDDEVLRVEEGEQRGRKGRQEEERGRKRLLGKRRKNSSDNEEMEVDDDNTIPMGIRGSKGKNARRMTPSQRKDSVKKILRERTASRREGSEPKRLDYKIVPEEHIRLAKKINAVFKHKIQRSEADREITVKKPKHLFAGKMSNGKKDWR